jgi:hypothetical protein
MRTAMSMVVKLKQKDYFGDMWIIQGDQSLCAPDDYNTLGYLAQSDCLTAERQGQGDTRLTLTPSVLPNSNYVIMVSD